jgi:hypothetical protein
LKHYFRVFIEFNSTELQNDPHYSLHCSDFPIQALALEEL